MTAQVLDGLFVHEHNRLAVAEQEWLLAGTAYDFEAERLCRSPAYTESFHAARERRSKAWAALWKLKRGY
jgi:hypothetical protein